VTGQADRAEAAAREFSNLVEAVWEVRDPEARVEAWKVVQRVLGPAASYDFEVRP
jgi:hypothetical protein